jgi:hypothetical protein
MAVESLAGTVNKTRDAKHLGVVHELEFVCGDELRFDFEK